MKMIFTRNAPRCLEWITTEHHSPTINEHGGITVGLGEAAFQNGVSSECSALPSMLRCFLQF